MNKMTLLKDIDKLTDKQLQMVQALVNQYINHNKEKYE